MELRHLRYFVVVAEERLARQLSIHRQEKMRDKELAKSSKVTLDALFDKIGDPIEEHDRDRDAWMLGEEAANDGRQRQAAESD